MCGQKWCTYLLASILCASIHSAEIRLAPGTWRGTATVTVVVAADGTHTVTIDSPIEITGRVGGPVPPVDPPPIETPLDKFRASVRTATAAVVDPNKAASQAAVAKLYAAIAGLPVTSREQLSQATDAMWGLLPLHASWGVWKTKVDAGLVPFKSLDEGRKAWQAVSEGVKP